MIKQIILTVVLTILTVLLFTNAFITYMIERRLVAVEVKTDEDGKVLYDLFNLIKTMPR